MDKRTISKNSVKTAQQENLLKNVRGTFETEGMILSESCLTNLSRIANGQASGKQILNELKTKYDRHS